MNDDKDGLPSDREDGGLKPMPPKDDKPEEPSTPPPDDKKAEQDPSEQPSLRLQASQRWPDASGRSGSSAAAKGGCP